MAIVKEYEVMGRHLPPKTSIGTWVELTPLSERHIRRLCVRGELRATKSGTRWLVDTADALEKFGFTS